MTVHVFGVASSHAQSVVPRRYVLGTYAGADQAAVVFWVIDCDAIQLRGGQPRAGILALIGVEIQAPLNPTARQAPASFNQYLVFAQSNDPAMVNAVRLAGLPAYWVPGIRFTRGKRTLAVVPWIPDPYELKARVYGFDVAHNHDNSFWHETGAGLGRLEVFFYHARDRGCRQPALCQGSVLTTRDSRLAYLLGAPSRVDPAGVFDHYKIARGDAVISETR
jgi:hypothetical protein